MATVPDDLDRQHTRISVNLHEAVKGALDLGELLLDIVGRNLPVGIRAVHRLAMDPRTALVAVLPVDIISAPANDNKKWQGFTSIQPVLTFCLFHQLPDVMDDRRQSLSPFESCIDRANLWEDVVLGLQQISK